MKMSDMITDQMNAMFQDIAINQNTDATNANTQALQGLTAALGGISETRNLKPETDSWARDAQGMALDESGNIVYPIQPTEGETETPALGTRVPTPDDWAQAAEGSQMYWNSQVEQIIGANEALTDAGVQPFGPQLLNEDQVQQVIDNNATITEAMTEQTISAGQAIKDAGVQPLTPKMLSEEEMQAFSEQQAQLTEIQTNAQNQVAANKVKTDKQMAKSETTTDTQMTQSANSMYAKMMQAANLYGIAYQAMSNDNLNTAQKFEMIAVQAAGQAAIAALTASMSQNTAQVAADTPAVASKTFAQLGPIAGPAAFAAITALLGGLLGVAVSKITRSKQEIAQATGASASATNVSAGKLMTGMLTYAEGNVNEFTDPRSLTEGRMYNVDGADGRTYRAKYMGKDARTHITNGPEFHLVGERGREAIIDANTTRMIQMNEPQIWQAIQTIYNGGTLRHGIMRRKGRGMAAFADGNMDDFETADGGGLMAEGLSAEQLLAFQASIDRQNELLADLRENGIEAFVSPYGPRGIVNGYDTAKKEALSHGERYL